MPSLHIYCLVFISNWLNTNQKARKGLTEILTSLYVCKLFLKGENGRSFFCLLSLVFYHTWVGSVSALGPHSLLATGCAHRTQSLGDKLEHRSGAQSCWPWEKSSQHSSLYSPLSFRDLSLRLHSQRMESCLRQEVRMRRSVRLWFGSKDLIYIFRTLITS